MNIFDQPTTVPFSGGSSPLFPNTSSSSSSSSASSAAGTGGVNTGVANFNPFGYYNPIQATQAAAPNIPAAPAAPDYSNLQSEQAQVQARKNKAIAQASKDFDALAASTLASGNQAANNAGNAYASRLLQSGINPIASGVVTAQAKLPVYNQIGQITTQKDQTILDASNKADALSAQISQAIASLQLGYSKTLADYNAQMTGYNFDLNKFNAGQKNNVDEFNASKQYDYTSLAAQLAAQLASKSSSSASSSSSKVGATSNFFPTNPNGTIKRGYVTNSGPVIPGSDFMPGPTNANKTGETGGTTTWAGDTSPFEMFV